MAPFLLPCGYLGLGNWHKYSDVLAVCCTMSSKVLYLLLGSLVFSTFTWRARLLTCKESKILDPSQFCYSKIGHVYLVNV